MVDTRDCWSRKSFGLRDDGIFGMSVQASQILVDDSWGLTKS